MSIDRPRLLVTDLDNTLWDWFEAWFQSFNALLEQLARASGIDREVLEEQAKEVHQRRRTTEYSNLLRELPALVEAAAPRDPFDEFDDALHAQNRMRRRHTKLYPGVLASLNELRSAGVHIVAYTESVAYWSEWRIRHTRLDGIINTLYSAPDHDLAAGVTVDDLRTGYYDPSHYGLQETEHRHVPYGVLKPNKEVLLSILEEQQFLPEETVYLGDSLMKDVALAQAAGAIDVHAAYGEAQNRPEYDLLRRVTHWSEADVAREKSLVRNDVNPTFVCHTGFSEVLSTFDIPTLAVQ